jgi:hypothetical protein
LSIPSIYVYAVYLMPAISSYQSKDKKKSDWVNCSWSHNCIDSVSFELLLFFCYVVANIVN